MVATEEPKKQSSFKSASETKMSSRLMAEDPKSDHHQAIHEDIDELSYDGYHNDRHFEDRGFDEQEITLSAKRVPTFNGKPIHNQHIKFDENGKESLYNKVHHSNKNKTPQVILNPRQKSFTERLTSVMKNYMPIRKTPAEIATSVVQLNKLRDRIARLETQIDDKENSILQRQVTIARLETQIDEKEKIILQQQDKNAKQDQRLQDYISAHSYPNQEVQIYLEYCHGLEDNAEQHGEQLRLREQDIERLRSQIQELEYENQMGDLKMKDIVRKQQEDSFKRIDTARWIPKDEGKIKDDLDSLKRKMRNVAKSIAIEIFPNVSEIEDGPKRDSFIFALKEVIRWKDEEDSLSGMSEGKKASLVLNALLTHNIYTRLIRPAFFFTNAPGKGNFALSTIYESAKKSNEVDAHVWRAQTLRLLRPQSNPRETTGESKLRDQTDRDIIEVAHQFAAAFLKGPASILVKTQLGPETLDVVGEVFSQAGRLSYELWTRKTAIRVTTLVSISEDIGFDINNPRITPHALVRYDKYEDNLWGCPIKMVVHPMVTVHGTDEGDNYDKSRVWVPMEVWLPSSIPDPKKHSVTE